MAERLPNAWSPDDTFVLGALRDAEVRDLDLLYDSSNYVFLASLAHPEFGDGLAVYKPAAGEAPLSDFPYGSLHRREVAAYELSTLLGWGIVPPMVERDGPRGVGSMQLFIDHDPEAHYFVLRGDGRYQEQYVRLAAFDLIANNADRKGGHMLLDASGRIWAIDNALCFHRIDKLRTVIWDFAGEIIPDALLADIRRVRNSLAGDDPAAVALCSLLATAEVAAFVRRCDALLSNPVLPEMYPWRCVPWPLV
jgi:uncharacterized repeat protein (TIGR03843 family)